MAGINLATAYLSIVPSIQGIQGSVSEAFRPAEAEAEAAGAAGGKKYALAVAGAVVAAGAIVGGALKGLYEVGSVFDDLSDTIRAGTGKSGAALGELEGIARTVATTIPTSFEAAGETVKTLSQRLNLTGDQLTTVSSQFLAAGNVLGEEVNLDAATKSLSVFGVTGDDVSTQLDTLFRISQSTGVGINTLTAAATAQGPALQELGFNLTDTTSLIGSLEKAGLNSTAITASMGKGLVKLAKDGEAPQEAYQRIVGQLGDLVAAGDNAAAIDLAAGIFGTKGATQFVGAIDSGVLSMESLAATAAGTGDTILGVQDATADAAESWQLFKNKGLDALKPLGDAVFGLAGDTMGKLTDSLDDVIAGATILATGDYKGGFFGLSEDSPVVGALVTIHDTVGGIWDAVKVVATGDFTGGLFGLEEDSPVVGALLAIHDVIGEIVGVVGGQFKSTFDAIMPVFAQVGNILGPAIVDVFNTLKPAISQLLPVVTQLLPLFNPVSLIFKALLPVLPQIATMVGDLARVIGTFVAGALTALAPLFQKVVEVINRLIPFISQLVISLLPPLMGLFDKLAPLLDAILSALLPVVDALIDALIPAIDALMPIVERVFTFIADTIANVMAIFGGVIDVLTGIFTGDWEKVWTGIQEIFGAVWAQIQNAFQFVIDAVIEVFTNLGPKLNEIINGLLDTVIGWGISLLTWIWDGIKQAAPAVWDWFMGIGASIWERIVTLKDTVLGYGSEFIGWIASGIETGAEAIWKWVSELPGKIWEKIVALKDDILELGKRFVAWIVEGIKSVANAIWDAITSVLEGGDATAGAAVPGVDPNSPFRLGKRDGGVVRAPLGRLAMQADGGPVRYNPLGYISGPGGPRSDLVPTMLSNGEYVVNARDTARVLPLLEMINAGQMAAGGFVGTQTAGTELGGNIAWEYARSVIDELKKAPAAASSNGNWGPGVTGGFAANTAAAKAYIEATFAGVSSIGGLYGGSVPGSDHPMGKALDVMIAQYLTQAGIANGTRIADWFIQNPDAFGTKYVIWRDRINEGGQWSPYQHPSGSDDTLQHRDHVHISFLTGSGQFAGSAAAGGQGQDTAKSPWLTPILDKLRPQIQSTATNYIPSAGVEQWRGLGLQALTEVGKYKGLNLTGFIDRMLNQIRTESSGNPEAINNTDINAQRGDPSIGLLQVIGSTFRNALAGTPFEYLIARGQRDPFASLVSSTLYSLGRYGTLDKAWRGVAYDSGGWLMPGQSGVNLLTKPEPVLTPEHWATAEKALALASAGGGGGVTMNVILDRADGLQREIARMIQVEVGGHVMSLLDYADQAEASTQ